MDFYRCTIESILTNCISVWYGNCSVSDRKALQRVVKTAQWITGTQLPTIENIYHKRCLGRARNASHPIYGLSPPPSNGQAYRSLRSRTSRLRKSFFPEAVILLNSLIAPCTHTALFIVLLRARSATCTHTVLPTVLTYMLFLLFIFCTD